MSAASPPPSPRRECYSTVSQVAVHVPPGHQTGREIEGLLRVRDPDARVLPGLLRQLYGFEQRRVAPQGTWPSDLAAAAGRRVLDQAGLLPDAVDLLIFASASEDVEEPATAHIVAAKVGVTASAFDVKNACNGLLNAMEIADALIRTRQYRRVLICTGERGSLLSRRPRHRANDLAEFLPACTLGDLGAALLMEAGERPGVLGGHFRSNSAGWRAATVSNPYFTPAFGTMTLRFDSAALAASFHGMETAAFDALRALGRTIDDIDLFCVHQPSVGFTHAICEALGIPKDKVVPTFPQYGNVATASLPLQLVEATRQARLRPGDLVALFGLASGAAAGMVLVEW
ncbi:3-oxoacyl-[acyl-carrier-protein] synthase III C-terminal domain-containing protein [Streptomyces huasconensis]|uniref:3-oxoacyl-[acyl-carrier-protein] synthase III C-terminal domain-containing protein n=1 Tax=Streptomyces huasconensis TaxID=1854574 RepID=A0ABV3M025_9ACTN